MSSTKKGNGLGIYGNEGGYIGGRLPTAA